MRVLSSLAIKEAYLELQPQFEKQTGLKVQTEWLGMVDIVKRVKAGEVADLLIASQKVMREMKSLGKVSEVVDLAKSGVAVAVKKGARRPDIGSAEAVKRALRAAGSIGYSSGPSGVYLAELFQKWGIAEELKPKSTQTPPGTAVGPLPAEIQTITTFSGGVHAAAKEADAARAWLAFITAPQAAAVLRKHGMDPAK